MVQQTHVHIHRSKDLENNDKALRNHIFIPTKHPSHPLSHTNPNTVHAIERIRLILDPIKRGHLWKRAETWVRAVANTKTLQRTAWATFPSLEP